MRHVQEILPHALLESAASIQASKRILLDVRAMLSSS